MLTGTLVRLRPVREDDLEWLIEECGKPSAFGEFEPYMVGAAEAIRWEYESHRLLSYEKTRLVIEDRNNRKLGVASIEDLDLHSRIAKIRVAILDPHERGKGLGTDAYRVLVSYLFGHLALVRIEAFVASQNTAARSVLKKIGFLEEGVLRARTFAHGQRHDVIAAGLLSDEWVKRSRPEILLI